MKSQCHRHLLHRILALCCLLLAVGCADRKEQMMARLAELERQNIADSLMTNDSLAKALVAYFDDHGTPNERLRAHYILGRTYADLGEAPAAIDAYLDAAACADTTAADCDYHTLSRVYGQMANVFYGQNLMQESLDASDNAVQYAWKDCDTLQALGEQALQLTAYEHLQMYTRVASRFDSLFTSLTRFGGIQFAAKYCMLPVFSLHQTGDYAKAHHYIRIYELHSGYYDSEKDSIEDGREVYYYHKGMNFLYAQQYDSAELCFRKELSQGKDFNNQNAASKGLALLFSANSLPDSAAKYALYSYSMNDSLYDRVAMETVARTKAVNDYTRYQKLSGKERELRFKEERRNHLMTMAFISIIVIFGLCCAYMWNRKKIADRDIQNKKDELQRLQKELRDIREKEKDSQEIQALLNEKEMLIHSLRSELSLLTQSELNAREEKENVLLESPITGIIHSRLSKSARQVKLGVFEQNKLLALFKDTLPKFYLLISSQTHGLSLSEQCICCLYRLHFSGKEIAFLLGKTPAAIAQNSQAILQKLFQMSGTGKMLKKKLEEIYQ